MTVSRCSSIWHWEASSIHLDAKILILNQVTSIFFTISRISQIGYTKDIHVYQNSFFSPFGPFHLNKKILKTKKNGLQQFWMLSLRGVQWKNPIKIGFKNENFMYPLKMVFLAFSTRIILKTVRDRKNLLAYYRQRSLLRKK